MHDGGDDMPGQIHQVAFGTREESPDMGRVAAAPPSVRARMLGWLGARFLSLQCATWHTHVEGLADFDRMLAAGEPVLLTFWHGKFLPLFPFLRGREACVFTTESFRGQVIGALCRHFGYDSVLLPHQDKAQRFEIIRRAMASHRTGAIAVDGPLGPYHMVKPRMIALASRLGFAVVPVSTASSRKKVLRHRWDQMERPALFTRVALAFGPPLHVPPDLSRRELAAWRDRLQQALEAMDRTAEGMIGKD